MKKNITTAIILTLFSIAIFGQESNGSINRLIGYNHTLWNVDDWEIEDSITFSYSNERGLIDNNEIVKKKWETLQFDNLLKLNTVTGNLINNWKSDITYDSNDNVLTKTNFSWLTSSESWKLISKKEYVYDSNNNILSTEYYLWDMGSWMKYLKGEYTYDGNNNKLSKINYSGSVGVWEEFSKEVYTYDSNNNELTLTMHMWTSGLWKKDKKELNTYDSNNNKLSKTEYNWVVHLWAPDAWEEEKRTTYSYYLNEYLSTNVVYEFVGGVWVSERGSEYLYDANNNILSITDYSWENSGVWEVYYIKEYTYDSNNNRKSYIEYVWSPIIFTMEEDRKWEYTYDENKNKLTEVSYFWIGSWRENFKSNMEFDQNSKIISQTNFDYNITSSSWNNYSFNKYYYEELDTNNVGIQEVHKLKTSYGPNPFTNKIDFTFESETAGSVFITITDVQGRFIYKASTSAFQGENTFSWNGTSSYGNEVAKGLYHFNISIDNSIATGKIVKK